MSEAAKLCSYMHFRDPKLLLEKTLLWKANLDKSVDFMDTVEDDIPKGKGKQNLTKISFLVSNTSRNFGYRNLKRKYIE